jgi:MFS family permease
MATGQTVSGRVSALAEYDALVLTAAVWFLAKLLRYAFPALFPTFRGEFGVSTAVLGTAFAVTMGVYSIMQFPSGVLADRVGSGTVIAGGAVVVSLAGAVLWVDGPFLAVIVGMVLVGAGTGVHKTVSVDLLSRVYPDRTGRTLGVFDTVGALGGAAAPPLVVLALARADWHLFFVVGGAMALVLAVGVVRRVVGRVALSGRLTRSDGGPSGETDRPNDGKKGGGLRNYLVLFGDRRFTAFVGVTLCFGFAYNGFVAFLPLFLTDRGVPDATVSVLFSALFVVSLVQLVTGDLADRVGALSLSAGLLALATVSMAALVTVVAVAPAALGAVVVGVGLGSHGFRPVRGVYLSSVVPEDVAGGGIGMVRTLLMGTSAVSPAVVGVVAEGVGFDPAFSLLAAAMAVGTGLAVLAIVLEQTDGTLT